MFSVVILTLNEEKTLPACLASVAGCDDVLVLDSGSTDATAEIARAAGARLAINRFETFAQQRNYSQHHLNIRHRWAFHLDADERFTPELFSECSSWPADAPFDGAFVAPRMLFNGKWVPRCTDYPAYQARFVRVESFRWVEVGHGQREADEMRMAFLQSNHLHEMLAKGEASWLEKHRRYALAEATAHAHEYRPLRLILRQIARGGKLERRRALKVLSFRLPARPTLRFLYQFALRGGFLDGHAGWHCCRLLARYEKFVADALRQQRALQYSSPLRQIKPEKAGSSKT